MEESRNKANIFKNNKLIFIGIGLSILFYVFESLMDTFVFHEGTLAERILVKDANELWMRLIIISFFIIFSIYAQLIIRRLRKAESEVKKMSEDLELKVIKRTAEMTVRNEVIQKQLDEIKRKGEEHQIILQTAFDGFMLLDINGNILDVNDSYCKMIGYTREEIIHMTIPDIESMETQTETAQHLRKIVEQRGDRFETRHRRKDGRTIDIEASVNYMELGSGYFFTFLRDITARKAAEKTIQRVNTALRTLSEANHALLHTNDEQELLDRICKIIVNNGGYRLAWVGYAEHDEGKTVRPVAYAGYEEGYLEKLNITWAETKYGMGPTGNAIRTGKPSVARKMMTDPNYIPWREEALKLGYTSSIALPLIAEGKSLGALNIYSSDKASFDTEEVKLLNDLAENLSFDIMGIRMKAEHNHILQELIKAEERLRHLLISNPAVIYSARADGDYGATFISENIHEQLGWRSSDFIGDSGFWAKNIHPDDSQRILTDFPKVFDHGIHIHEYRFRHKNGSWRWMHDEMKLIKDREGKPIEIVGYWVDITNHKQIEEELLETKANLESTVAKRTEQLVEANESLKTTIAELEQRNQESTLINDMADMLLVSTSSNEAYNIISQFAIKLFHEFAGLVAIFNASHNLLEIVTIWGSPQSTDAFTPDECLALRRGQTYNVKDPKDTLICPHITIPDNKEPLPYICVPMMAQGEILGVLYLQDDPQYKESHSKPETKERLAKNVAEHLALAIATLKLREKLRDQSIRDPLTGLFNRRYMEETLGREFRRAIRNKSSFGIIMVDIDYFKRFNDTFGHEAGDMVLRTIGDFLKSHIRGSDIACRYGGEEFAIILADASQEETQKRAEGLREGVKRMHLQFHGQLLGSISISLGVAIYPLHGITENELLRIADDALYLAKKEGRDRVIIGEISGG